MRGSVDSRAEQGEQGPRPRIRPRHPRFSPGLVLLLPVLVAGCVCACRRPGPSAPAWDRDLAVREVLTAVLDGVYVRPDTRLLVVDETLDPDRYYGEKESPPAKRLADVVSLPNGTWILRPRSEEFRPRIAGITPGTLEDWVAHSAPMGAPRSLSASRPIVWFSEGEWGALKPEPVSGTRYTDALKARWRAFHARFPASSGWVHLSNVGFSPDHDEALLQASYRSGLGDSAGYWVLLRRDGVRWVVAGRQSLWRS